MSTHLTSQQFAEALLSQETPAHLRECPACNAELADLRATLGGFRASAHQWSEQETTRARPVPRRLPSYALRACAAASILLLAIAGGITYSGRSRAPAPADTALLERVNAGVSRSAPGRLQPLMVESFR